MCCGKKIRTEISYIADDIVGTRCRPQPDRTAVGTGWLEKLVRHRDADIF